MKIFTYAMVAAALLFAAAPALAQAQDAPATPEPADTVTVETPIVVPESTSEPELPGSPEPAGEQPTSITVTTTPTATLPSPVEESAGRRSIEQRVIPTEEPIRVQPKSRKNVSRLDNQPGRRKAKPIAVIKGPVSPWGYANRYLAGEVYRPAAKDLQGKSDAPGIQRQGGGQPGASGGGNLGGLRGRARRESD